MARTARTARAILDSAEMYAERLSSMRRVFEGADRIIGGEGIKVELASAGPAIPVAWTDGQVISINVDRLSDVDVESLVRVYGVNFHEMCHVLWTPRRGTTLISQVLQKHHEWAFNILEDQRIESMMISRYASTKEWLTTAIANWVLAGGDPETAYLFVRGRRYLDGRLRGMLRAKFKKQHLLPEIDRIIDRYRVLVFPTDYNEGAQLIEEFHNLLVDNDLSGPEGQAVDCPHGHGNRTIEILVVGRPKTRADQQRAVRRMVKAEEPEVSPDGDEGDDGDSDSKDGDEPKDGDAGGGSAGTEPSAQEILDVAQDVLDAVMENEDVKADIRRALRQIRMSGSDDLIKEGQWTTREPLPEYKAKFTSMHRMLTRLSREADPGWIDREDHGKVNLMRWSRDKDVTTAFDLWDEGVNDAIDMEVVIALDTSGSTAVASIATFNAMWVVKRALDRIEASTTVITFSGESEVLYHRNDRANQLIRYNYAGGGTVPVMALAQATHIFARTRKTQKILLIFTDGDWADVVDVDNDDRSADDYIFRMNRGGVITALGHFPGGWGDDELQPHGCSIARKLSVDSLVPFMQSIVVAVIRQRLLLR